MLLIIFVPFSDTFLCDLDLHYSILVMCVSGSGEWAIKMVQQWNVWEIWLGDSPRISALPLLPSYHFKWVARQLTQKQEGKKILKYLLILVAEMLVKVQKISENFKITDHPARLSSHYDKGTSGFFQPLQIWHTVGYKKSLWAHTKQSRL